MEKTVIRNARLSVKDLALTGMMTALLAVCAWVTIPFTIPFTLQTFGVFMALRLLGGRRGTAAIGLYILLGIAGVPVFSGFGAGICVLPYLIPDAVKLLLADQIATRVRKAL